MANASSDLIFLLIDDNPDDRALVKRELNREFPDCRIIEITDQKDLDAVLEEGQFNFVITDYQIRWTDGLKVLNTMKTQQPYCPVIMFTGTGSQEIAVEAMKTGLDDYVVKSPKNLVRLSASVRLIIEKNRQREAAEAALAALGESEDRYRLLVQHVSEYAIFMLDPEGLVASWNDGADRLLGYREEEVLGENFARFFTDEGNAEGAPEQELKTAIADGQAADDNWLQKKDGSQFYVHGTLTALRDPVGKLRGFTKVMRDVTDRMKAEEEREALLTREHEARLQAEAANRLKDEFLATVSHELRTPLNAILGWAKLIREKTIDATTLEQALETIERNARMQVRIIEDLLDVSRIITGKLRLDVSPMLLSPVIVAAADVIRPAAEAKKINLVLRLENESGFIIADGERLQQVIWNLLSNAVKFTPIGGTVTVELETAEHHIEVIVRDNGQGIAPEFLPHVFDRFRQADQTSTRAHGGLGLGLAITRHLVELHGGTVSVHSAGEGRGATFIVRLPLPPEMEA